MSLDHLVSHDVDMSQMPEDPFGRNRITELIYGTQNTESKAFSGNRDAALHELLGTDYEHAHESGLVNLFYYNPDSSEDGLMHVLGGEYFVRPDGTRIPRGFHHEPSASAAWTYDDQGNIVGHPRTYVDRTHLESKNSRNRKAFAEHPFEPYQARVVIDGLKKMTISRDRQTGESQLVETNNGMFPKEYDALAVMKAIKEAHDTRDKSEDRNDETNKAIFAEGTATKLDGKSRMKIRMVLDAPSGKVISAYPLTKGKHMVLSQEEIQEHLGLQR